MAVRESLTSDHALEIPDLRLGRTVDAAFCLEFSAETDGALTSGAVAVADVCRVEPSDGMVCPEWSEECSNCEPDSAGRYDCDSLFPRIASASNDELSE